MAGALSLPLALGIAGVASAEAQDSNISAESQASAQVNGGGSAEASSQASAQVDGRGSASASSQASVRVQDRDGRWNDKGHNGFWGSDQYWGRFHEHQGYWWWFLPQHHK
ncbi:hypothetical protein [Saccharopolyspora sp. 5N708]|uniref:hypothetical protein n=1 Tax=Saccharopolyspora sp. 5N708 TaxID=3457424 RepID=UPI003FCF0B64